MVRAILGWPGFIGKCRSMFQSLVRLANLVVKWKTRVASKLSCNKTGILTMISSNFLRSGGRSWMMWTFHVDLNEVMRYEKAGKFVARCSQLVRKANFFRNFLHIIASKVDYILKNCDKRQNMTKVL